MGLRRIRCCMSMEEFTSISEGVSESPGNKKDDSFQAANREIGSPRKKPEKNRMKHRRVRSRSEHNK